MVRQNLVAYITSQHNKGKTLQEITEFLINAGYDKEEVESSVQYIINLERSPEVAEQQRIQQLADYIRTQVDKGYDQHVIINFLISKGYPYFEVNSAINSLKAPKTETRIEHKLGLLALVTIILVSIGVGIFYLSAVGEPTAPAKLLDVTTNKLTTLAKPGSDLSFQVNIVNLGEIRRYDVTLDYMIIEKDTNRPIAQQTETVAISTSTQRVVSLKIPKTAKPGKYLLKAVATYAEFNATSGFLFEIIPEKEAKVLEEKVKALIPENITVPENVSGPTLPEVTPPLPETVKPTAPTAPTTTPSTQSLPEVAIPKTEEDIFLSKSKVEAIEFVKAVSVRDAPKAVSLCKKFKYDSQQAQCIQELARFKKDPAFCLQMNDSLRKDSCIVQLAMETKNTSSCSQISDANVRQTCDMLEIANAAQDKYLTPEERAALPQVTFAVP